MNYNELKKKTNTGWNTWNTSNVLSHVHLPHGFAINLCIREFKATAMLRESLIGRFGDNQEQIIPGPRTYDGRYTELNLKYYDLELEIRTTVVDDEQIILLTPLKRGLRTPQIAIEACLMWGKDGCLSKNGNIIKGVFPDREFEIFTTGDIVNLQHTYSLSPYIE
jgi:hypothetical protein